MTRIRIQIPERERSCAVDAGELQAWGKSLLDEILFAAARQVTAPPSNPAVCALFEFRVTHDDEDGSIIVEYGYDTSAPV